VEDDLVRINAVSKKFGDKGPVAIKDFTATIVSGRVTGLVGSDGAGKTTLLRLMAGLLKPDSGTLTVCGNDTMREPAKIRRDIAYMPQRFGLYEELSVIENLNLYADLRSVVGNDRKEAIDRLLAFTSLGPFTKRHAGALSGGMKQKLGLACALIKDPRLLLLDEPSVGVDPISRRELWRMVYDLAGQGIGVVWSTAYLDEAERCKTVFLLNEGGIIYHGPPSELTGSVAKQTFLVSNIAGDKRRVLARALEAPQVLDGVIQGAAVRLVLREDAEIPSTDLLQAGSTAHIQATAPRFEDAFMVRVGGAAKGRSPFSGQPKHGASNEEIIVEADRLTRRFGDFTAADNISFSIKRGEIFGLIGPNGAGKSTIFKMLCGLLRPSSGTARVAGLDLTIAPGKARARLGYMAQKFSLYGDLSVRQNLTFFAGVYGLKGEQKKASIKRMIDTFELAPLLDTNAISVPLGFKQRLALACAVMHDPDVLFLDEPTSGVDPRTRREFWTHINAMVSRGVTVLVTTHFLDEAEYCDRIALIYHGRMIASGAPDDLKTRAQTSSDANPTLEDAFIALVEDYDKERAA
jgi:drug efflux transport system ATP-binding protein